MCKHVSAVLYAIGVKFDSAPALFFKLRSIDFGLFPAEAVEGKVDSMLKNAEAKSDRVIADEDLGDIFGPL